MVNISNICVEYLPIYQKWNWKKVNLLDQLMFDLKWTVNEENEDCTSFKEVVVKILSDVKDVNNKHIAADFVWLHASVHFHLIFNYPVFLLVFFLKWSKLNH